MPELDLLFLALLFFAEVLGTIGGFGSSMLVMPLAGSFLPFDQALGLTAVFHVFSNAAKIILFRQGVDRRLLVWLGVPAVILFGVPAVKDATGTDAASPDHEDSHEIPCRLR